jgi:hypothetical protein
MGTSHADGYSASVKGYLVVGENRFRLAKTNGATFVLAEPCDLPAGTTGELVISIDGHSSSRLVELPAGVRRTVENIPYRVTAPF